MAVEEKELLEYACARFQECRYEEALEAFVLAYSKGYEQEWILNNIYGCYMEGNEQEFRNAYEQQEDGKKIPYEECILDFVPYREGEYYIFDKELGVFRGIFSMEELQKTQTNPFAQEAEFSAKALVMDGDWNADMNVLADAREREVYAVCRDLRRALSFLKIPELTGYMDHVKMFADYQEFQDYFHKNTAVYLPKILSGSRMETEKLAEIIHQEHQYRLTPEGRNTDNVLLTIGIPTHDRGNLVLKRLENLLKMQYDAEIEIAISKNGTTLYQEEYEEVSRISDARINYYDHGKELKYNVNWSYVMEMAHGKYVLLVSDEDDVVIDALEHYFKLLSSYPDLNLVRAKSAFQRPIKNRIYGKKGLEAFRNGFAQQNYLSGLIIRREDFLRENFLELEKYSKNPYYQCYPHEWWCAFLNQKGDYMEEPVLLIIEQEAVMAEETKKLREIGVLGEQDKIVGQSAFPVYSTYQARLAQFKGQIEFLHLFCGEDNELMEVGLSTAIGKVAFLFELAFESNYERESFMDMVDQCAKLCIEAIEGFPLSDGQKKKLLIFTRDCCTDMHNLYKRYNK